MGELTNTELLRGLFRVAGAFALALPVGWERDRRARAGGLRTFPLVAVGACAFILVGEHGFERDPAEQSNLLHGVVTGVGMVGWGALLTNPESTRGMATAVSIWITAAIGIAMGFGLYVLALPLSLLTLATLLLPTRTAEEAP